MTEKETVEAYTQSLAGTLRLRGMPEPEIEVIINEVKQSGSRNPVAEFGKSDEYAQSFTILKPVSSGRKLWWWGFGAGAIWAVTSFILLVTRVWQSPTPAILIGVPFIALVLLGGLVSIVATHRKRPWQRA